MHEKSPALPVCYCAGDASALRVRRATWLVLIKRLKSTGLPRYWICTAAGRQFSAYTAPDRSGSGYAFTLQAAEQFFTGGIAHFQPAVGGKVHHQILRRRRRSRDVRLIGRQRRGWGGSRSCRRRPAVSTLAWEGATTALLSAGVWAGALVVGALAVSVGALFAALSAVGAAGALVSSGTFWLLASPPFSSAED